jgi:hypothetical protein
VIHFPNSLNPDLSKIETNQKRQSDIMDLWAKMMETQTEILQKQEIENKKTQRNNYILTFIVGIATLTQTYFAYLDYKKSLIMNEINMSNQEKQKQDQVQPKPKRKGRKPQEVERKLPLTKEEEETLKKSEFGQLLSRSLMSFNNCI